MTIIEHLKRSALPGTGVAMLLALALGSWLFSAEEADLRLQQRQRLAVLQANGVDAELLCDWIEESYRIVAPKRLVAALEAGI